MGTTIVVATLIIIKELTKIIFKFQEQKYLNQESSASFRQSVLQNSEALSQEIWKVRQ